MKISTRQHGLIDYGMAALLGGLSASRMLPPPVSRLLGAAGAYHAGYAALTDYEGGLTPALSMRQHLALDTIGGTALLLAGLAMRRQPDAARALLVGIGITELAVTALSSTSPRQGPGQGTGPVGRLLAREGKGHAHAEHQAAYPPLDTPKPVADGVFVVDSILENPLGAVIATRMTVLRLPDGGLLLHSPTRFSLALKAALQAIGPVRHLVAPNLAHWTFMKPWQDACPEATTWAAPGLRGRGQVRRSGVRLDHDLGAAAPPEWGGVVEVVPVPGGAGFTEVALFHRPSETLVLTDLVLNLEEPKVPLPLRPVTWAFGVMAPEGMPPPYLRAVIRWRRPDAARAAERLVALNPVRVVFAHGRWFEQDGAQRLRRSLRWLLG